MDISRDQICLLKGKKKEMNSRMPPLGENLKGNKWVEWNSGFRPLPTFVFHPKVGGVLQFPYYLV